MKMWKQPPLGLILSVLLFVVPLTCLSGCARKSAAGKASPSQYPVTSLAFSPDGTKVAAIIGPVVKCWDAESAKEVHVFTSPAGLAAGLAFSPDGKTLAAGFSKTIRLWDVTTGNPLRTIEGHKTPIVALGFLADGKTLVAAASLYNFLTTIIELWLWDAESGKKLGEIDSKQFVFNALVVAPDKKSFATGSRDTSVKVWNGEDKKELANFKATNVVYSLAYASDGKTLAVADGEPNVTFWDTATWKEKGKLEGLEDLNVNSVSYSPDGKSLALARDDPAIQIWDVSSMKPAKTLVGHAKPVRVLLYSPDGKTLASGAADGEVRIWDTSTGETRATLK
jgi:WD40 repeat protein